MSNKKISNYFMLDAAVAAEAYGSRDDNNAAAMNTDTVTNPDMRHPSWNVYENRLWSSEWHLLFDNADNRRRLTWRNIFADRPSTVNYYNFYSSGEEVLDIHKGEPNVSDIGIFKETGQYAWALQEKLKGDLHLNTVLGSNYGGWGFNNEWDLLTIYMDRRRRTPSEAAAITNAELSEKPFYWER